MEIGIISAILALGIWYWIPLTVLLIWIVLAALDDSGWGVFIPSVLITAFLLYQIDGLLEHIILNPLSIITYFVGYVFIGTIWSLFRWYKYVVKEKRTGAKSAPEARYHKDNISYWMFVWPLDTVFYILGDLIRDTFRAIWNKLGGLYQRISDSVFENA